MNAISVPALSVSDGRNLKTVPWGHQKLAIEFLRNVLRKARPDPLGLRVPDGGGALLAMGMGCVDGDADLIVNRAGRSFHITMRRLHYKLHGGMDNGRSWDTAIPTKTGSLGNGEIRLNRIVDSLHQGRKPVVNLTLASGKTVRLTPDHRVAQLEGWTPAQDLQPGARVLTNGTPVCDLCASSRYIDKDGYIRLRGMYGHPRATNDGQLYEHIFVMEQVLGRYITSQEEVHHKDRNRQNNAPNNLEVLSVSAHKQLHCAEDRAHQHLAGGHNVYFLPKPDTVVSVVPDGEADVYDLVMEGPAHNFVAQGVIVHNCGKTLVAESMVCNLDIDSAIVAAPLRVVPVWPVQIVLHAGRPDIRVVALDGEIGTVADKTVLAQQQWEIAQCQGSRLVVVVNYESLWRPPLNKWVLSKEWGLAILDESHRIKQASGKASMFCSRLGRKARYRLCLTGTPMPHSPLDIYAQYRFLDPSIFGTTYSGFKARYAVFGGFNQKQIVAYQNLPELEARMARICFRVGKEVLDLPEDVHVTYECDLSAGAQRVYDALETEFVAEVATGTVTAANAMVKLLRLAQVTSGFVKPDGQDQVFPADEHNAKAALLEDTLEDIAADEAVVIFCRFHADLDVVHEIAQRMGRGSLELSGRRDELLEWQSGGAPILAVQIQSGGVGIDLTRARYSIYYSIGYSLGDYDQSLCRVHRPGQKRPVLQIHLAVRHTVDVRIMRALEKRAEIVASILDEIAKEQEKGEK